MTIDPDRLNDLYDLDECVDPRFDHELVNEVALSLSYVGFDLAQLGDLELVELERTLHGYLFGGECR